MRKFFPINHKSDCKCFVCKPKEVPCRCALCTRAGEEMKTSVVCLKTGELILPGVIRGSNIDLDTSNKS